jgi:hypothetical protein
MKEICTLHLLNAISAYNVSDEQRGKGGGKRETPATFLSALMAIKIVSKYFMRIDDDNTMAALSSIKGKGYRVRQELEKQ